jgi:hypothetical protein
MEVIPDPHLPDPLPSLLSTMSSADLHRTAWCHGRGSNPCPRWQNWCRLRRGCSLVGECGVANQADAHR